MPRHHGLVFFHYQTHQEALHSLRAGSPAATPPGDAEPGFEPGSGWLCPLFALHPPNGDQTASRAQTLPKSWASSASGIREDVEMVGPQILAPPGVGCRRVRLGGRRRRKKPGAEAEREGQGNRAGPEDREACGLWTLTSGTGSPAAPMAQRARSLGDTGRAPGASEAVRRRRLPVSRANGQPRPGLPPQPGAWGRQSLQGSREIKRRRSR